MTSRLRIFGLSRSGLLAIALLSQLASLARAEVFTAFRRGQPATNYDEKVKTVGADDILVFDGDGVFKILETISRRSSGNSAIFAVSADQVLRIAMGANDHYRHFLNSYIKGYRRLREFGVPIPEMYLSLPDQFVLQRRVSVIYTMRSWLDRFEDQMFDQDDEHLVELRKFLLSTWRFEHIGDFRPENIVWTGKTWILLDWTEAHRLHQGGPSKFSAAQQLSLFLSNNSVQALLVGVRTEIDVLRQQRVCAELLTNETIGRSPPLEPGHRP